MTREDVNDAIARLRAMNRQAAGSKAYSFAATMLPVAAKYRTPRDLAALWILALSLYDAAGAESDDRENGVATLAAIPEERYARLLHSENEDSLFDSNAAYPEVLQNYARALSQLPRSLVASAFEAVIDSISPLLKG
jgi:hypothetical protein